MRTLHACASRDRTTPAVRRGVLLERAPSEDPFAARCVNTDSVPIRPPSPSDERRIALYVIPGERLKADLQRRVTSLKDSVSSLAAGRCRKILSAMDGPVPRQG